ncbi:MAG: hypothetical protein HYV27_18845 [Candidatus Hydrogenedentes bacterium]|nr:hypothetical protein [Candidatus Hydrogenedentota bacterium]
MVLTLAWMLAIRFFTTLLKLVAAFLHTQEMGRDALLNSWVHYFAGQTFFLLALCGSLVWLKRRADAQPARLNRYPRFLVYMLLFGLWVVLLLLPHPVVESLLATEADGTIDFGGPPMILAYSFAVLVYAVEIVVWAWWCDVAFGRWRDIFRVVMGWGVFNVALALAPVQTILSIETVEGGRIYGAIASGAFGGAGHLWVLSVSRGGIFYPEYFWSLGGLLRYVAGVIPALIALDLWRRLRSLPPKR